MQLLRVHCTGCDLRAVTARPGRMVDLVASHMAHGAVVVTAVEVSRRRWRCRLGPPANCRAVDQVWVS